MTTQLRQVNYERDALPHYLLAEVSVAASAVALAIAVLRLGRQEI